MRPKYLEKIIQEVRHKVDIKKVEELNIFDIHFGICLYIRNKYLWTHPETVEELKKYFNSDDVDTLSHKILDEIKKEDLSQSSNPNR